MLIQLNLTNLETGETQSTVLETPILLGSDVSQMPQELDGKPVSHLLLTGSQITACHALIIDQDGQLTIAVQHPGSELSINGVAANAGPLQMEDYLQVGVHQIQIQAAPAGAQAGWVCDRQVGFLIQKRCGRTTTVGCPYCNQGHPNNDPYYADHAYYPSYGYYGQGDWGSNYYDNRYYYNYDPATGTVDFTEADAVAFDTQADMDYEQDMGAS